jgi:hypothetical protein
MISAEDMRERLTMTRTSLGQTLTTVADLQKNGKHKSSLLRPVLVSMRIRI